MRFFNGPDSIAPPAIPYGQPRAMVAAVQILNLAKGKARTEKRPPLEWQTAAWRYYEMVGEIHYAFNLISQILSRVRLYVAVVTADDETPADIDGWLERMEDAGKVDTARKVAEKANELLDDLVNNTPGRQSGLMASLGLNFCVPGEAYLAEQDKQWLVLSTEELTSSGGSYRVRRSRQARKEGDVTLSKDAFVARLFRASPRYSLEPDSSMLAVLDVCEQLVLLDQVMRAMARRAMNAGLVFIPEGITAFSAAAEDETLADSIAAMAVDSVESEGAISTVTPKVVTGPAELGDKIKPIKLSDAIDPKLSEAADRLLERIMAGLDIPKEVVRGIANVKYANAIVIEDSLYRAHIEPLVLLIVDGLTTAYLQPRLLKACTTEGEREFAQRLVLWGDTSSIVIRPDKSQAADVGYDKHLLSGEAWRRTRGFDEGDAPSDDEILTRLAVEKAPVGPELATVLIERLNPEFFAAQRQEGQEQAGIPADIGQLLSGETAPPPETGGSEIPPGGNREQFTQTLNGGEIAPGGTPGPLPAPRNAPIPV